MESLHLSIFTSFVQGQFSGWMTIPILLPEPICPSCPLSVGLEAISGAAAREMLRACLKMKNFIPPWGLLKNEQSDIFYIVQIFWEEEE